MLFVLLAAAAGKVGLPYQIGAEPRGTGTDASAIQLSRGRKAVVKLLARFVIGLAPGTDFTP